MSSSNLLTRDVCNGFAGNSDLYGLGIRIGIYLQWISSLLTNILLPNEVSDSLDTNSIFLFAVFIAIAKASQSSGEFRPAEAFIMLQLCFGYLLSVLSVSGLRLTLFNVASPELLLSKIRLRPDLINTLPDEVRRQFDMSALFKSQNPIFTLMEQLAAAKIALSLGELSKPPPGVTIPAFQLRLLKALDIILVYSAFPEIFYGGSGTLFVSALEPVFWGVDFYVFFRLARLTAQDADVDEAKAYVRERLLRYKHNRKLVMKSKNPQIFTLGLTSVYKNDQVSWLGVVWRSCIVAGIGIYNVWFWFGGIGFLRTDSCPSYVFLFCKANILGGARTFFKVVSVIYVIYGGALIFACFTFMLAFIGTTCRALLINMFIMPYAKLLLLLASTNRDRAKRRLETFDATRSEFLRWLDIPSVPQLLCGMAYLSSTPKEETSTENGKKKEAAMNQNEAAPVQQSVWIKRIKVLFLLAIFTIVILTIITVELTLVYNSVNGVYTVESTGQLIPLIIGVVSFGKISNAIYIDAIKQMYPDWANLVITVNGRNNVVIRQRDDVNNKTGPAEKGSVHNVPLEAKGTDEDHV